MSDVRKRQTPVRQKVRRLKITEKWAVAHFVKALVVVQFENCRPSVAKAVIKTNLLSQR